MVQDRISDIDADGERDSATTSQPSGNSREPINVDPADLYGVAARNGNGSGSSDDSGNTTRSSERGRGRPAGSNTNRKSPKPSTTRKAKNTNSLGIENLLYSIHLMLAKGMKIPEMELSKEESEKLGAAISAVQEEYGFTVDPKIMVWAQFAGAVSSIYAPRFMMYKIRVAAETKKINNQKKFDLQESANVGITPTI